MADVQWFDQPVLVLNGPNLGRLGTREPNVYGETTHTGVVSRCQAVADELGLVVQVKQTDAEYEMLHWLHDAADNNHAVVINAGAWTHTSVAVRDALVQVSAPVIEVHISNVYAREGFRHQSYLSAVSTGVIVGLGVAGYDAALRWMWSAGREAAGQVR